MNCCNKGWPAASGGGTDQAVYTTWLPFQNDQNSAWFGEGSPNHPSGGLFSNTGSGFGSKYGDMIIFENNSASPAGNTEVVDALWPLHPLWNGGDVTFSMFWKLQSDSSLNTHEFEVNAAAFSDLDALSLGSTAWQSYNDSGDIADELHATPQTVLTIHNSPAAGDMVMSRWRRNDGESGQILVFGVWIYQILDLP